MSRAPKVIALVAVVAGLLLPGVPAAAGATMRVDATRLTNTSFLLVDITPPITPIGVRDGTVVQTLDLDQGAYVLQPGAGIVMSCTLFVSAAGTWDYATECDGFLAGRGTDTLVVLGYPIDVDATALSNNRIMMPQLFGAALLDSTVVQSMRLVPARGYVPQPGSGVVCNCFWDVALDGTIQFPTAFDGFMGGRGTNMVVLRGYTVNIDATALSANNFVLPNAFGLGLAPGFDANVVQPVTLLPVGGGYGFQYFSVANFIWNIDLNGAISYDARFEPYLDGLATNTLVIAGYPVEVDATALGPGSFQIFGPTIGALDRSAVQSLTLVPATPFEFFSPPIRFAWRLLEDGTIDYDPSLDECVRGRGTNRLTILCDPAALRVEVDVRAGSEAGPINLGSRGLVPVAILTTPAFDATTIDAATVCFGDAENAGERDCTEAHGTGHVENVDGDGDLDLVLHFDVSETGIDPGDTSACLTGETAGGTRIRGCDAITVVP